VEIVGTAADSRFAGYRIDVRPGGAATWDSPPAVMLGQSATAVYEDVLTTWDTSGWPEGEYDLRLAVSDTLGLVGVTLIRVIVDNEFPFVDQTVPARIAAAQGGDVYTTNGELHLFFPPNAFDRDAIVTAAPLSGVATPDSLPGGAVLVTPGFELGWSGGSLQKTSTVDLSFAGCSWPAGATLALYAAGADSAWRRVGGTVDPASSRIRATLEHPGRLALFSEVTPVSGGAVLSPLSLAPRVFSPRGRFSSDRIAVGFSLGRAAPVTVKVYNRAGRLVREVTASQMFGAGANLVYWDGHDRDGRAAPEGMYLVTVEALGETRTKTLAVVE
jgi:hypothetical protein